MEVVVMAAEVIIALVVVVVVVAVVVGSHWLVVGTGDRFTRLEEIFVNISRKSRRRFVQHAIRERRQPISKMISFFFLQYTHYTLNFQVSVQ